MNYDITMCRYDDCPLAVSCKRFVTYKAYMEDKCPRKPTYIAVLHSEDRGLKCDSFWDNSK